MTETQRGKCGCRLIGGTLSEEKEFSLSGSGWTATHKEALAQAGRGRTGYATLICGEGSEKRGIALYQCSRDHHSGDTHCGIERVDPDSGEYADWNPLAGMRRRKKRRR